MKSCIKAAIVGCIDQKFDVNGNWKAALALNVSQLLNCLANVISARRQATLGSNAEQAEVFASDNVYLAVFS